ncbi:MAG: response regulator [Deltaproteobacteria bacterium]|nr:response regulator [Deltaproteobacteria bacterium]MBW2665629.1 response regulator [Deltaproteobacteria bacterium]
MIDNAPEQKHWGTFSRWPIDRKLALVVTATTLAALALSFAAVFFFDSVAARRALVRELSIAGEIVSDRSTAAIAFDDPNSAMESLEALAARPSILGAVLLDGANEELATFTRSEQTAERLSTVRLTSLENRAAFEGDYLHLVQAIELDGRRIGTLILESDLRDIRIRQSRFLAIALGVGVFSFALSFVLSSRLRRIISDPVLRLADAAQRVARERDYSMRVPRPSEDELGALVDAFNSMLEELSRRDVALIAERDRAEAAAERANTLLAESREAKEALEHEVVERRRLESQMQRTQKLESLGVLSGGIAHDFNNLLTGILGNADMAFRSLPQGSRERDLLDQVKTAAEAAADLTAQLLAYSGRGSYRMEPIDLSDLVDEMGRLLGSSISKKVRLEYDLGRELPLIEVDPTQIRQVVMNLITNASEAIGDAPGDVRLHTGAMYVGREKLVQSYTHDDLPPGEYVFVEVADSGCGMSEETLQNIFDPFFTTKFTGRGLGLAALLGIVRRHRGTIFVSSQVGAGTTFRVLLPASDAERTAEDERKDEPAVWQASGRVLVIDDEPGIRRFARMLLDEAGFEVELAADGDEGIEMLQGEAGLPDLVLLDLTMPRKGGIEVLSEIRKRSAEVPVVLMSGFTEGEVATVLESDARTHFLQKPFTAESLEEVLRTALAAGTASDG